MVDIDKHIHYWRSGAEEDFEVAGELLARGHSRHALFFAHLALEKLLKALVCRTTNDLAPRTHNLVRLAEGSSLLLESHHTDILADMNAFCFEGRYPDAVLPPLSKK
jgi:HEPN domain-containing protein